MASLTVLEDQTSTNGAPSASTDGVALWRTGVNSGGLWRGTDRAVIKVSATNTASTVGSITLKIWGYDPDLADWFPLGTDATDANKGLLNEGNALGETGTDVIQHTELVSGLTGFTRVYCEVTAASNITDCDVVLSATSGWVKENG